MTPEQIKLVQDSFAKVRPIAGTAADLFYGRLFEIAPQVRPLFPDDMAEQGIDKGDVLDLTSHFNGETRTAERFIAVPYEIPSRCAATYFPETNVLVPIGHTAEKSNTPVSKYIVITVAPTKYEGEFDPSFQRGKAEPEALEQGRPAPPVHA